MAPRDLVYTPGKPSSKTQACKAYISSALWNWTRGPGDLWPTLGEPTYLAHTAKCVHYQCTLGWESCRLAFLEHVFSQGAFITIISALHHRIFHYEMHLHILFTSNSFPTVKIIAFWANMHMDDLQIDSTFFLKLAFFRVPVLFLSRVVIFHVSGIPNHNYVLFLPFGHVPPLASRRARALAPRVHGYGSCRNSCFNSSSPHFSLKQVLFILHWRFLLPLRRDLSYKTTARSCSPIQVLPLPLLVS